MDPYHCISSMLFINRGPGKKRLYKDSRWGRGGKRDKRNTQESAKGAAHDGFSFKRNNSDVFKVSVGKAKQKTLDV